PDEFEYAPLDDSCRLDSSVVAHHVVLFALFLFTGAAPPEIYTLSLHDALPISFGDARRRRKRRGDVGHDQAPRRRRGGDAARREDRKSTRLNSSHSQTSYAVFCLKKKS